MASASSPPRPHRRRAAIVSPLASWFLDDRAVARFRRRRLGRTPAILMPRDRAWRAIVPGFMECVRMAGAGLPFHIVADRRVDRGGDPRRLPRALALGRTAYLPQVHQVLPRLMRLMVVLRTAFFESGRAESSFLFIVEGTGRPGMGLHHDGEVDAFWLQLEGRRTVTVGPRVPPGTAEDLDDRLARAGRAGWRTVDLEPGSLFHLPARTPHAVVCRQRSLAVTLTWARAARPTTHARRVAGLLDWDVVSGFAEPIPPRSTLALWVQVPILAERLRGRDADLRLRTHAGEGPHLPAAAGAWAARLSLMPRLPAAFARAAGLSPLVDAGILGPRDLPLRIRPEDPAALDGWRFA